MLKSPYVQNKIKNKYFI